MFKMTKISAAALVVLGGGLLASSAFAQDQTLERVEVTGSAIKRIDAETAVPVTIVKMDDLKKAGVTSVEQIMASLSAVQMQSNTTVSAVGSSGGGATFADIRGIGSDKTLILLNGQRIANNAVDGSSPDLNMIPFAAIERIEVLRDGASSLYGTDAIGGVINFITKKDFQGFTVTVGADSPQHPGGKSKMANIGGGFGDLNKQGFNVFGFFSAKQQDNISGSQRDFNQRIPGGLSSSTSPANYTQDFSVLYNPSAPGCAGFAMLSSGTQCKLNTSTFVDFAPKTKTFSGMLKGTVLLNQDTTLGLELFKTQNEVTTLIAPVPYGGYYMNPTMPNGQPNPYFPTSHVNPTFDDGSAGAPAFGATSAFPNPVNVQPGFVYVLWRDFPNGPRGQMNKNDQDRLLLTLDGTLVGWDYGVAASYNKSTVGQYLISGYANGDMIGEGLLEGVINPFGAQTSAGTALLNSAALNGELQSATGKVTNINAHASREVGDWFGAGHQAQLAVGVEHRNENFVSGAIPAFAALVEVSTGVPPNLYDAGKRNVDAIYSELNVPILKNLDVTASVRYDKYSDFGNTTNPKLSFRYQPTKELLLRGSASTGFRAPTLYELYGSQTYTNTAGDLNNPVTCPTGTPNAGTSQSQCNAQFQVLQGGNAKLRPEKSKSWQFGAVFEPAKDLSFGADFWWVRINQSIGSIAEPALFANYSLFKPYFHFVNTNQLSIISNCPGANCGYVDDNLQNLGGNNTNGVDLSAAYKMRTAVAGTFDFNLNSTYVAKYEYQDYTNGPWIQNVGTFAENGPVFRWQHNLAVNWSKDAFGAGGLVHYKSGYADFTAPHVVSSYTTMDVYASWSPIKAVSLVAGVRNLFDRDPPFTNQAVLFQSGGWDPRFTDPTGRAYYLRGTYTY